MAVFLSHISRGVVRPTSLARAFASGSAVPLTADRKTSIQRGNYAKLTDKDVATFERLLDRNRVLTDVEELAGYNTDWMRMYRGQGQVVLRPKSTSEVSAIMRHCFERKLAVVPQGGNTSLVGASVPIFDEVIISLGLMNDITDINPLTGVATCEAGVILEQLDSKLKEQGLCAPLDLGAKGSCQIGGNISTNAGGLRLLRYGSLRGTVLGLEAVLPNGDVLDCLNKLRKDNTGYDLKQLFIGAEGTLGIVTAAAILCPPAPQSVNLAFLGVENYEKVMDTYRMAKMRLSEILSAFELMDRPSLDVVERKLGLKSPLNSTYPFHILIETSGSNEEHDMTKLNSFLETVLSDGVVSDGTVAQDSQQIQRLWAVREEAAEALNRFRTFLMYDVTLDQKYFYAVVEETAAFCRNHPQLGHLLVTGFGHFGDGNVHLNVVTDEYSPEVAALIEPFVFQWVTDRRGSISAEHGLGLSKNGYLHLSKPPEAIEAMRGIKNVFDPTGIMNPYKFLPPETLGL